MSVDAAPSSNDVVLNVPDRHAHIPPSQQQQQQQQQVSLIYDSNLLIIR